MAKDYTTLGWDYVSFVFFVGLSIMLPLLGRQKNQKSKADFVFATGGVSIFAIMLSIARGTLGIRSVLGYPSELYYRGSGMWEVIYGMVNAYPIVCFVFVPVYFNLGITSVYQYLDLRFKSRLVRCLASGVYVCRQVANLGITVYTPSVALAAVIGIPYWASIVGISFICVVFTVFGGLKAAINADVIQTVSVIIVTMAVIVSGAISAGGAKNAYNINKDNGRLKFFNFTGDMSVRVDTTSAWLGQLFMSLSQFGCQQNFMQRYISLKSIKEVKRAMMSNIPLIIVFFSLAWLAGIVIYATYVGCDPLAAGYIQKQDEILPFFVEDQLAFIPGFVGLFMATLFNGALCLNVSNLNSISTVLWEDFLSLLPHCKGLTDKQQLGIIKLVTVVFGIIIMAVAFSVGLFSGVIESSMLAFSATSGPLLGAFVLAMLVPHANWKGTATGMIVSMLAVLWITFGNTLVKSTLPQDVLPTSTETCTNFTFSPGISKVESSWIGNEVSLIESQWAINSTNSQSTHLPMQAIERTFIEHLYSISYMYYSLIGTLITLIIGVVVSYFTRSKDDEYDSKLLHPFVFRFYEKYIPGPKPYYIKAAPLSPATSITVVESTKKDSNPLDRINHGFQSSLHDVSLVLSTDTNPANAHKSMPQSTIAQTHTHQDPHPDIIECQHWESKSGTYRLNGAV